MPNFRRTGHAVSTLDHRRRHSSGPSLDLEQFQHLEEIAEAEDNGFQACNAPKDFMCGLGGEPMYSSDLSNVVKVVCTNQDCSMSPYMHADCFDGWEQGVLDYLKSSGKARCLTDKQSRLTLWTKRGYELAYKACLCACMQGHLRKDLSWSPPSSVNSSTDSEGDRMKRRRRKNKNNKPTITIGLPNLGMYQLRRSDDQGIPSHRVRTSSLSSSTSYSSLSSPATSPPSDHALSHTHSEPRHALSEAALPPRRTNIVDRSRHDSGGSIFLRRSDYSSFNVLPRHKINSYHIKMEDECSIGNDENRCFILSSYASNKMNRVPCVLCGGLMNIFERYPLIDGTFFLSPRQHAKTCIQVKAEGRLSYLSAVCMGCLEGWNTSLHCRYCLSLWDGSQLILGTMYSFDIFAAVPCCPDRLKCAGCNQLVIHPEQRFNFFSDYSQTISCPSCGVQDFHFTKPLNSFVSREDLSKIAAIDRTVSRTCAAAVRS